MNPHKTRLLVLDDEPDIRGEINEYLAARNYIIYEAAAPSEAFSILKSSPVDIAIIDIRLPEMDGLEVLKKISKTYPHIQSIIISGHGDMNSVIRALRLGAVDFFKKPFAIQDMLLTIERTRKYKEQSIPHEGDLLKYTIDKASNMDPSSSSLIVASPAMKSVVRNMKLVAKSKDTTVLITGESGTGKELIARGIHFLSSRHDKPFHAVNCSTIPNELFESEFFGYNKGAFTGATIDKPGWFEVADGGTLFLDEIGDLKLNLQAKLLRIMEDRQISRLGSTTTRKIDVRVITATNQDLEKLIHEGRFRRDLYHRINTFVIYIPPLRERTESIPALVTHFLDYYCQKMARKTPKLENMLMAALQTYDFPGNVRELKHMMERALILCESDFLTFEHFDHLKLKHLKTPDEISASSLTSYIDESARASIENVLRHANNNKSLAARMLNISRQALDRKMKKLGISGQ